MCSKMQIIKKIYKVKVSWTPTAEKWWLLTLTLLSYHLAFNSLICIVILQIGCVSDLTCVSLVQSRTFPDDTKYPAKLHQSGSAHWAAITSRPCMLVALAQWTVTSHSGKAPVGQRNLFSTQWLIGDPALFSFWYVCPNTDIQGCPRGWRRLRWTRDGLA